MTAISNQIDGLSIAWATLEHLHEVNGCRALFATHYHELTHLSEKLDRVENATVAVKEFEGDVIFLHEVRKGAADRSYGVQVARLAGLPDAVIARARVVLDALEKGERVLIVEDVTTAGTSVRGTVPILRQAAAIELAGLVISVDRQERGTGDKSALAQLREEFSMPTFAIVTIDEVVEYLRDREVDGRRVLDDEQLERIAAYRAGGHDGVVCFGGGSALDLGKMIALMVGQTIPVWDLEDVGDWWTRADAAKIAPIVAVPTTAGTGSEVGRAGVLTNSATHRKKIIFHPKLLPAVTICDPELTVGMPKFITAGTGLYYCSQDGRCEPMQGY